VIQNRSNSARLVQVSNAAYPRCVAIGGGTGLPAVLTGLRRALRTRGDVPDSRDRLTAIVTVTDDGGSSGWLRREFDMLPAGDIRNCLAALAPDDSPYRQLIQHRFSGAHDLAGHPIGNLILAALTQMSGDFQSAVGTLSEMMALEGTVLPSTRENVTLRAEFQGGETRMGETAIASCGTRIKRLSLDRPVRPAPEVLRALINADVITVGPGSLYTSIIPNLLVDGIAATMSGVRAVRIYVANLMTEPGETEGYTLVDHLEAIRSHVGFDLFDYVLVNTRPVNTSAATDYARRGSRPVVRDSRSTPGNQPAIVERDLSWQLDRGKIRHSPNSLAQAILELARIGRPAIPVGTLSGVTSRDTHFGTDPSSATTVFSLPSLGQKSP
jgi:uncharacterized cofD-like protein